MTKKLFMRQKMALAAIGAVASLGSAHIANAADFTIINGATQTFAANNGTLGGTVTLGTNGQLILNATSSSTTNTFTTTLAAGGTPNRGTATIRVNTDPASLTILDFTTYTFTPNKTDLLIEAKNIGGTGSDAAQIKFTGTGGAPPLFGAAPGITGYNATILVHDLATNTYNFGTYDSATGIRGLSTVNANDYAVNALTANTNVLLTSSLSNAATAAVNSLTLRSSGTGVNLSGAAVSLPSYGSGAGANGIFSDGDTPNTLSVASLSAAATDGLTVHTIADLTISSNVTSGWLTKANSGKLTLTGSNNFTAANIVSINAGTLSISSDNNLGPAATAGSGVLIAMLGGTLQITSSTTFNHPLSIYANQSPDTNVVQVTAGNAVTLAGGIATRGSGGITFSGPGTTIVTGPSSYTNATNITGGTLVAANAAALSSASASTKVAGGANLQINNGITVAGSSLVVQMLASNSRLTVGSTGSVGTAGITGGLTGSTGGNFDFDINGTTAADKLTVSSTVTAGGTWTINLNDLGGSSLTTGTPVTLLSGGTFTGTPTLVGNLTSTAFALDTGYHGNGLFWDTAGKTLTAQFVSAPEPASVGLLALGGFGLLGRRRRRA